MQIQVNEDTKKTFEPVTLTITIESEEELKGLWGRMNLSSITVTNADDTRASKEEFCELFEVLDKLCDERGL